MSTRAARPAGAVSDASGAAPDASDAASDAFDAAADAYDRSFTDLPLGRLLREPVWDELGRRFAPGDRVLELGCGTGEDAVHLARRGVRVTATDASPRMLEVARRKAAAAGLGEAIRFERLELTSTEGFRLGGDRPAPDRGAFDGAFSNFGALNCLADRRGVAAALAARLRPGAPVVLVVMGPFCPWEVGWHLLRFSPSRAFRRFRSGGAAMVGEPPTPVRVWYPPPRRLRSEFAPWFVARGAAGIGVVLPPPYLARLVEGRPGLAATLAAWDRRLGRGFPGTWLNDHYLLVLERR